MTAPPTRGAAVHVRIGVTYNPREIEIELPDDADPEVVKASVEKSVSDGGMLWLTDRKGHQVGDRGRQAGLHRSRHGVRLRPHRLRRSVRLATPARDTPSRAQAPVRHRQGWRRQDHDRRRAGAAGGPARQAHARRRGRRQGQPGRLLRGRRHVVRTARDRPEPLRDVDAHRGVAQGVPATPVEDPGARPHRAAGPHLRLRRPSGAGREGGAHGRQVPVGGARAPLRPRRRRRRRHRPRRRAAGGAATHPRAREGRPRPRADRLDDRHPRRRERHRRRDRRRAGGDAGQRDDRASPSASPRRRTSTSRRSS